MPKTSRVQFNLQPIHAIQHHERLLLIFLRAANHAVKNIRQLFLPLDALDVKIVKAIRQLSEFLGEIGGPSVPLSK
jgi:hypothetical protein